MNIENISRKMKRSIDDIEFFTSHTKSSPTFVYRYGVMAGENPNEASLVALFHADSEESLNGRIKTLDAKFHKYTDTGHEVEYDKNLDCWYATYAVYYPFDKEIGNIESKPLF